MINSIHRAGPARRFRAALALPGATAWRWQSILLPIILSLLAATLLFAQAVRASAAETDSKASSTRAAHDDAVRAIPLDKFSPEEKARVMAVLSNTTIFRRLPAESVECEPELFHFLVHKPEVVASIWQVMGVSNVVFDRLDDTHFRCTDGEGTTARGEFAFRNFDTVVVYAEGIYDGPLFPRTVRGQAVLVLKTASIRETNGRYYVTARLDTFLHVDNVGVEILAKMFQGWLGHTIDHNFSETVSFLGSISHAAENNPQGMRRMAAKLNHVDQASRDQFIAITDRVADKMAGVQLADDNDPALAKVISPAMGAGQPASHERR